MADPKMKPKIYGPGWEEVEPLGSGGQGKVFLVRSPEGAKERNDCLRVLKQSIRVISSGVQPQETIDEAASNLASAISGYTSQEDPAHFGALKLFDIGGDGPEAQKALARLESEVKALTEISHPNILKLLHADVPSRLMITEYHPKGPLATTNNRDRFRGNVQASLEAFRPLVEAVAVLHERGIIHRDIKPANIFVGSDGRLILGDFGIVFFQDERKDRLTSTYGEKVGTADWMAPWVNVREQLEEVNPTFDTFPLGKVLWWMISGKPGLPFWYHNKPEYDLKRIYPEYPDNLMDFVSLILKLTVCEEEIPEMDAKVLLRYVDNALAAVTQRGHLLHDVVNRPCHVCGKGQYTWDGRPADIYHRGNAHMADAFTCDACGHIQLFK